MGISIQDLSALAPNSPAAQIRLDTAFPGGNLILEKKEGDLFFVRQDLRDTEGDWFWWCFRIFGAANKSLTFRFPTEHVFGAQGPAVSLDQGLNWTWLGPSAVSGASFSYSIPAGAHEVRLATAIPYTQADWDRFLNGFQGHKALRLESLCKTQKGREAECLFTGRLEAPPQFRVLLTARHHACESMANFVLEGLIAKILAEDEEGQWFRDHAAFLIAPFMDKDGVEEGDQGKNRRPHDHNRDYRLKIYPSVEALTRKVPAWAEGNLQVALDLHDPWIRGKEHEEIQFIGGRDPVLWERVLGFSAILESVQTGPLPFRSAHNLPFGQGWNQGPRDPRFLSCQGWSANLPNIQIATTIEIPYAKAGGQVVTAQSARAFGLDLARAIRSFLLKS